MEQEILKKLEEINTKVDAGKKDWLDIISAISSIFLPLVIAGVGWYFTERYNSNQLEIQKTNNTAQMHLEYAKLLIDNISGSDTGKRNFAIRTILHVDTTFGKIVLNGIVNSNTSAQPVAAKALTDDLIIKLFAADKSTRVWAGNEILSKWQTDQTLNDIISTTSKAMNRSTTVPDLSDGIYNCFAVLNNFPVSSLKKYKPQLLDLGHLIPQSSQKTLSVFQQLVAKL